MQTKICTSIAQSRKLIELGIDRTTADMYWDCVVAGTMVIYEPRVITLMPHANEDAPCWSLAALLDILPKIHTLKPLLDLEDCSIMYSGTDICISASNPIDACYETILKLHELKML